MTLMKPQLIASSPVECVDINTARPLHPRYGAPATKMAHYPNMELKLLGFNTSRRWISEATAVRFFGLFNFLNPTRAGRLICYRLWLSALAFCPVAGIGCALGIVMLDKPGSMNAQNAPLPVVVTGSNFNSEVLDSKQPVLVEFWAPWSRPCQVLDPVLLEVASTWAGKVKLVKVNADDCLDLSLWYDIQSVPTLLYFVRGNPCLRIVGTASKQAILAKLNPFPICTSSC
jgi:thioredoxin 1